MSMSPYFFIEKYDADKDKWEQVALYYKKGPEYKESDLWPWNGTHDLFTIIQFEDSYTLPEFRGVHVGLPKNVSEGVKKWFDNCCYDMEHYSYTPDVHWFNLADAMLYLKDYPTVEDEDAMEEAWVRMEDVLYEDVPKSYKPNPLQSLVDRMVMFLEVEDDMWKFAKSYSDVRFIGWVMR